jgi:hypothetical protein
MSWREIQEILFLLDILILSFNLYTFKFTMQFHLTRNLIGHCRQLQRTRVYMHACVSAKIMMITAQQ